MVVGVHGPHGHPALDNAVVALRVEQDLAILHLLNMEDQVVMDPTVIHRLAILEIVQVL